MWPENWMVPIVFFIDFNLVGGFNMWLVMVSIWITPTEWENKIHVPNHQPVNTVILSGKTFTSLWKMTPWPFSIAILTEPEGNVRIQWGIWIHLQGIPASFVGAHPVT